MKNRILILAAFLVAMGCGHKHDQPKPALPPTAAVLISPAQNEACATGTIISATTSSITFSWNAADHADSYKLMVKNLLSGVTQIFSTTDAGTEVTLLRNMPYSWYVISESSKTSSTAKSATWKFYNSGVGAVSYAPFPADLTSPAAGDSVTASEGKVGLKWAGSDADDDIVSYDVYFGTTPAPALLKSGIKDMFLNDVDVNSGDTCYWEIVTKDAKGNASISDVSHFIVK